ncbi:MAG TPA: hypothetical protein VGN63_07420 [Flavisolibacter sp.]|jgi:hypothetical protein|nr:hypothetical protein [Flavisolibacter sp.]
MKNTCVLKFNSLGDIAFFLKNIQPNGYTVNTVSLTLSACLTPFERSVALENYRAEDVKTVPV